jgi:hypothetical protein
MEMTSIQADGGQQIHQWRTGRWHFLRSSFGHRRHGRPDCLSAAGDSPNSCPGTTRSGRPCRRSSPPSGRCWPHPADTEPPRPATPSGREADRALGRLHPPQHRQGALAVSNRQHQHLIAITELGLVQDQDERLILARQPAQNLAGKGATTASGSINGFISTRAIH